MVRLHEVGPEDTLLSIACLYDVSVQELKRENALQTNDDFFFKRFIRIPDVSARHISESPSRNTQTVCTSSQTEESLAIMYLQQNLPNCSREEAAELLRSTGDVVKACKLRNETSKKNEKDKDI